MYNGYKNRETWLIALWFSPSSSEELEAIKEQFLDDLDKIPSYLVDFIDFGSINWSDFVFDDEDEEYAND